MKRILFLSLAGLFLNLSAQKWVDTTFKITKTTVNYGSGYDFAGNNRTLDMDICVPQNDNPPSCGRPLLMVIHGGAFMSGSKEDYDLQRWMKDFAKRGYVTASINYRLGQFQTNQNAHCNVTQLFNVPWDCSNMADTAEWYRGCYRGIQDAKGALRYLIANRTTYKIDARNVFLAGESAGGFIALGTAFLDTLTKKPANCGTIASVIAPNSIYENICVKQFNWDTSIASMRLSRNDLGPIEGSLNVSSEKYMIKGVGNFFGGMFPGWLSNNTYNNPPAIYLYHQPNDLIVPYGSNKVLTGFSNCFLNLGCASLMSNPWVHGSAHIVNEIKALKAKGKKAPAYWFDSTNNTADCVSQGFNTSVVGHAIDNYQLRTLHLAQYFAPLIDTMETCYAGRILPLNILQQIQVYPNPFEDKINLKINGLTIVSIQMFDLTGKEISIHSQKISATEYCITFDKLVDEGFYLLYLQNTIGEMASYKIMR